MFKYTHETASHNDITAPLGKGIIIGLYQGTAFPYIKLNTDPIKPQ